MAAWDLRLLPPEYEPENACARCGGAIEADMVFCHASCAEAYDREQVEELLAREGRS